MFLIKCMETSLKPKARYGMIFESKYVFKLGGRNMFQKKQKIYSETQGVCIVDNIVQLPAGKGETIPYYVLKSVFDTSKVSYIPVNNHQVSLRELFTEEEARELLKNPELEKNELLKAAVDYVLQSEE